MTRSLARRYAAWIDRHRHAILAVSVLLAVVSGLVASRLKVHADFSYLLPPSTQAVRDLRAIEKRARVVQTIMLVVESDDPEKRAAVARALRDKVVALGPDLVSNVRFDEKITRQYAWDNRWLFASLDDLRAARDALADQLRRAKLKGNPLYVDFEDEEPAAKEGDAKDPAAELRARLADAERKKDEPAELVSRDGRVQLMIVSIASPLGASSRVSATLDAVKRVASEVRAQSPGVQIGVTGDPVVSGAEHASILQGMVLAVVLTVVIVLLGLLAYYGSVLVVGALSWSLVVGTVCTFAFAYLNIGYLNLATAFLSSIVLGNGINFGIMLAARHAEERLAGRQGVDALAEAIDGSVRGTIAASLTAAVAYGSLMITAFRGFRHFGIIGAVGILLCWVAAYTVLPAALAVVARRQPTPKPPPEALSRLLTRLLPQQLAPVAVLGVLIAIAAGLASWQYLAKNPFETNYKNLRSDSPRIDEARAWNRKVDEAFGRGISGGFVIALDSREEASAVARKLKAVDEGKPEKARLFFRVNSLDDLLPADQPEKLEVLADIRRMLSEDAVNSLSEADRAEALRLRPPDDLRALGDADVPDSLAWPFVESDGTRGRLVIAMSGAGFDPWQAADIERFTSEVRALALPESAKIGGAMFVFRDILADTERDGPRATLAAIIGSLLVVALTVGVRRHGLITIACGAAGTALMLAFGSLAGLRVNFLDFVALPITIGIGIDYAVNIAARERQEGPGSARRVLATTGGAVLLCSYTTIIGYASLLLSENKGIRSFGLAAIIGETTCLVFAMLFAPAWLEALGKREQR